MEPVKQVKLTFSRISVSGNTDNAITFSLIKSGARAREYENAITWLINAGLIHRSYLVTSPKIPLNTYRDVSRFKIFACDIGLLGAMANVPAASVESDRSILTEYQGAFAENYVAQHLTVMIKEGLHYWKNGGGAAKIDFLLQNDLWILPVEVKAGMSIRSKSLLFYLSKYQPDLGIRFSLRNLKLDKHILNILLYAIQSLNSFLQ